MKAKDLLFTLFQSTPSVWRATSSDFGIIIKHKEISIHALRVEGDDALDLNVRRAADISIHALRVEGDNPPSIPVSLAILFQSTPSVWRATYSYHCVFVDS